jgi:signal transduction histidine kinase
MTLARKTIYQFGLLSLAMTGAAGGAIGALLTLRHLAGTTREEFEEFQSVREIEKQVGAASLALAREDRDAAIRRIDDAIQGVGAFERYQSIGATELDETHADREHSLAQHTNAALRFARERIRLGAEDAATGLATAQRQLSDMVDEFEHAVTVVHAHAAKRFATTLLMLVGLFLVLIGLALVTSLWHYRSVIGPLTYARDAVRRLAGGDLAVRLQPRGDAEFTDLQSDFNRMAAELESLYRDLERRVAEQSKQLAVSERLASVGFLAAGVAHEINNPLAIMSGYAESLLRRLGERGAAALDPGEFLRDLEVIRDEAFRCKKITGNLLDLSRGGDGERNHVSIWRVVEHVVEVLRPALLRESTAVTVGGDRSDPLFVSASEPELNQVVLNLAMNAAQAISTPGGRVDLQARRTNGWIELAVSDNGCGMTSETLEHVFEPFFTRRKAPTGTGLGLSISHAIVRRHHGELIAHSPGAGQGSTLTLRLPAPKELGV